MKPGFPDTYAVRACRLGAVRQYRSVLGPVIIGTVAWFLVPASFESARAQTPAAHEMLADLEIVRERVIAGLLEPEVDVSRIERLKATVQPDGTWPDIDYEDVSRTGWEHRRHLFNIIELSRAYRKPASPSYHDAAVKQIIFSTIDFWLEKDFVADNWYQNQIRNPDNFAQILLILDTEITGERREQAIERAGRGNLGVWGARPGGDRIKIAAIVVMLGLYERNVEKVQEGVAAMAESIHVTTERGLQPDLSFHHRTDRVTSTLSYGMSYPGYFAPWGVSLAGTAFAFPSEATKLLIDYYLDGIVKTMVHGTYPDPGAKNRSITRPGTLEPAGSGEIEELVQLSSHRKDELEEIIAIRKGEREPALISNRFFWSSEYFSHQRPDFFTSVRMFSSRNHSMEQPYNSEGLKNHHYADGSNFISRTGREYEGIFPVWDWQKIPGTTVVQKPSLPDESQIQQKGLTDFVGGVSDGTYGAAAFDFKSPLDPLVARKAWFFFDEEYVSLGAGIRSESAYPVATTLNQSRLEGEIRVSQGNTRVIAEKGEQALDGVSWVHHDGIAYLFPSAADVHLRNRGETGSWRQINRQAWSTYDQVEEEVFALWLDHGVRPEPAGYAYVVVPGIQAQAVEDYRKASEIEILSNTTTMQAVQHRGLGITQIVFYEAGAAELGSGLTVLSESPSMVMIKTEEGAIHRITVADPTRTLKSLRLKVTARLAGGSGWRSTWNEGYSEIEIDLPENEYAGQSVIIHLPD